MGSEEKVVKSYSFFNTLKTSIFQFDKYYEIMQQKTRKMILFLFEIIVIVAVIITGVVIMRLNNAYDYIYKFAQDNLPDFTITKDGFHMEIDEPLIYNNSEFFNSVVVFDNGEDNKQYLSEATKSNVAYLVITKNSLVFKVPEMLTTEYKFKDIFADKTTSTNTVNNVENTVENTTENVVENATENTTENKTTEKNSEKSINKQYILNTFNQESIGNTIRNLALYLFLLLFLSLMLISVINIVALAVLGYAFSKILRLPFKFSSVFNMAVASSTLPTILLCVYMVINILTGFVIEKFDILYAVLSYIYLVAAILILRSNMIKTKTKKEEKVAAETGNSNVQIEVDSSEVDSEDDDEEETEEEKDDSEE